MGVSDLVPGSRNDGPVWRESGLPEVFEGTRVMGDGGYRACPTVESPVFEGRKIRRDEGRTYGFNGNEPRLNTCSRTGKCGKSYVKSGSGGHASGTRFGQWQHSTTGPEFHSNWVENRQFRGSSRPWIELRTKT